MNKLLLITIFLGLFASTLSQQQAATAILLPGPILLANEEAVEFENIEWLALEEVSVESLSENDLELLNEDLDLIGEAIEAIEEALIEAINEFSSEEFLGEEEILAEILVLELPVPVFVEDEENGAQ